MKYEFKYIVPVTRLDQLREAISPFVKLDPYAAMMENKAYTVRSVYFDSLHLDYYHEKIDGYKIRKKIRIRGYNTKDDGDTVFMEIKRKLKEPIEKAREPLTFEVMRRLMAGEGAQAYGDMPDDHGVNGAGKFLYHVYRNNLKPVVLVIYEREAYTDRFSNDVILNDIRITFDKNLRSIAFPGIDDLYSEEKAIPALKDHFIMEVKFRDHFPHWLRPITGRLGLVKRSASKYVMCIESHHLNESTRQADMFRLKYWNSL